MTTFIACSTVNILMYLFCYVKICKWCLVTLILNFQLFIFIETTLGMLSNVKQLNYLRLLIVLFQSLTTLLG